MEFGLKCKKAHLVSCDVLLVFCMLVCTLELRMKQEESLFFFGSFTFLHLFILYINKKIMHTFFFHMNKFQKNFNSNLIPISCCIRNSRVPHKDTYRQRSKSFDVVFQIPSLLPTESRSNPQWLKGVAKSKNQKHSRLLPFIKCLFELVWNIALPSKSIQS